MGSPAHRLGSYPALPPTHWNLGHVFGLSEPPYPHLRTGQSRQVPELQDGRMPVANPQPLPRQTLLLPLQALCPQAGNRTPPPPRRKAVTGPALRATTRSPRVLLVTSWEPPAHAGCSTGIGHQWTFPSQCSGCSWCHRGGSCRAMLGVCQPAHAAM